VAPLTLLLAFAALSLEQETLLRVLEAHLKHEYIVYDRPTHRVAGAHWPSIETPAPIGSLIKPFTALAWAESHQGRYPEFVCRGTKDGCWRPNGHGRLGITEAIAYSCNAWFSQLHPDGLPELLTRFGLQTPDGNVPAGTLYGLGDHWRFAPVALLHAYSDLLDRPVKPILDGLKLAALKGTASKLHGMALAKTGTAPCPRHPGDGLVIAALPASAPRFLILVRAHGTTGANAAAALAAALATL
jgi:hypothetical protein